jgi:hypothetical protein
VIPRNSAGVATSSNTQAGVLLACHSWLPDLEHGEDHFPHVAIMFHSGRRLVLDEFRQQFCSIHVVHVVGPKDSNCRSAATMNSASARVNSTVVRSDGVSVMFFKVRPRKTAIDRRLSCFRRRRGGFFHAGTRA